MNTLLLAYRNRPALLRTFLSSLAGPDYPLVTGWPPIIIVDLGSTGTEEIIAEFDQLDIRHEWIDYSGIFQKSKATNHALALAETEFVTIVDVDSVFPAQFFYSLTDFAEANPDRKVGMRIKYIDPHHSNLILSDGLQLAQQWFTKETGNYAHESHAGFLTGNSHLCMKREKLISLGGLDERFVGYGWEDHDLNMRCVAAGIETVIYPTPIVHLWHQREKDWYSDQSLLATKEQYERNKAEGFPVIGFGGDWR